MLNGISQRLLKRIFDQRLEIGEREPSGYMGEKSHHAEEYLKINVPCVFVEKQGPILSTPITSLASSSTNLFCDLCTLGNGT